MNRIIELKEQEITSVSGGVTDCLLIAGGLALFVGTIYVLDKIMKVIDPLDATTKEKYDNFASKYGASAADTVESCYRARLTGYSSLCYGYWILFFFSSR